MLHDLCGRFRMDKIAVVADIEKTFSKLNYRKMTEMQLNIKHPTVETMYKFTDFA